MTRPRKAYRSLQLLLLAACLCAAPGLRAQDNSFIYIQGDKKTPFSVLLEGEELPDYSGNYCIVPLLHEGVSHIEIRFPGSDVPPAYFALNVPASGQRALLLHREHNEYQLFDLEHDRYLVSGNTPQEDYQPVANSAPAAHRDTVAVSAPVAEPVHIDTVATATKEPVSGEARTTTEPVSVPPAVTAPVAGQPNFINNLELSRAHTIGSADTATETVPSTEVPAAANTDTATAPAIANSDCPAPVAEDAFSKMLQAALEQKREDRRLSHLLDGTDECYTSEQVSTLAQTLSDEEDRYTLVRKLYARTTDQANFSELINLFSEEPLRRRFEELIRPK